MLSRSYGHAVLEQLRFLEPRQARGDAAILEHAEIAPPQGGRTPASFG